MPDKKKKAKSKVSASSNVYTALLGLSAFSLIAAIATVCVVANQYYGSVFKVMGENLK